MVIADTLTLDFRNLVVISVVVVFLAVLAYRLLNRDERIKRTRFGIFIERNRYEDEEPNGILYHMPPIPPPSPPPPIPEPKEPPVTEPAPTPTPQPDPQPTPEDEDDDTAAHWPHRDDAR